MASGASQPLRGGGGGLKRSVRYRVAHPARYIADLAAACAGRALSRKASGVRILLASDGLEPSSEQQFAPFHRHRRQLTSELGVVLAHLLIDDVLRIPARFLGRFDVIVVKLSFRTPAEQALWTVQQLRARAPAARLVYFDGDDDLCIQWPAVLGAVDLYVKKHVFANRAAYGQRYIGKSNLTDHVARSSGLSFDSDPVPSSGPIDPSSLEKLMLGYNLALNSDVTALYQRQLSAGPVERDLDIVCRMNVPEDDWMLVMRQGAVAEMEALAGRHRVVVSTGRLPQEDYYHELRRARICVSPFGYGEICRRDFEAVLCGALLVKPDMDHVATEPDIFVAGETYVPVRWDYADLREKCEHYLSHEQERRRMAEAAVAAVHD